MLKETIYNCHKTILNDDSKQVEVSLITEKDPFNSKVNVNLESDLS